MAAARAGADHAGQRVLAGAEVALRLARELLEDPVLGPRYVRTALLQGAATIVLAAGGLALGDELIEVLSNQKLGPLEQAGAVGAAIWGALLVAQWVVVALSREFHDALSRALSLKVGVEPEDPERAPRVRLDLRWMRAKLKRRWRALWVLVPGLLLAALIALLVGLVLPGRALVQSTLTALWAAHWWVVWTCAKSAHAWLEPVRTPPWYLRVWDALTAHTPGFRWRLPRAFGRFWHRVSRTVWGPVAVTEAMPLEFTGLSLVRLVGVLPVVKFFVRPIVPVASAVLLARGPEAARSLALHGDLPRTSGVPQV